MLSKIFSASMVGISPFIVAIEVDISLGMIMWNIVGLPDMAIKESKQRIMSALKNSGFKIPDRRITINLSPADLKKEGTIFDLPIAIGILEALEIIKLPADLKKNGLFMGELGLDGRLLVGCGSLSMAKKGVEVGKKYIVVPVSRLEEVLLVKDTCVIAVESLVDLVSKIQQFPDTVITGKQNFSVPIAKQYDISLDDIVGNTNAKRAAEIVSAGGHPLLLIGSPGSGKTMIAERLKTILPAMTYEEYYQVYIFL
jgi:magnesium chelatase family protein